MCFERVVVREGWGDGGPEEGVVVGEEGEEYAEEEGCCCAEGGVSLGVGLGGKGGERRGWEFERRWRRVESGCGGEKAERSGVEWTYGRR